MQGKNGYYTLAMLILISLNIGLYLFSFKSNEKLMLHIDNPQDNINKILFSEEEIAEILSLPEEEFKEIADKEEAKKKEKGVVNYNKYATLPMVRVRDKRYYKLDLVIEWLNTVSIDKINYRLLY